MLEGREIIIEEHKQNLVVRVPERLVKRSMGSAICSKLTEYAPKKDRAVIIDLKGRAVSAPDAEKLRKYVEDHCGVTVARVYSNTSDMTPKAVAAGSQIFQAGYFESDKTLYLKSTVRCGQIVDYEGSIILIGNLNAGGVIHSKHSIVILGDCFGEVYAGASLDSNAFVFASSFMPVRVSIGDHSVMRSEIPHGLVRGNVICGVWQGELIMKRHSEDELSKGCVLIG